MASILPKKNRLAWSWLNLIMVPFSGPTGDMTLKFKAAKPTLIKINNPPEQKPENAALICPFF
jgi:hypothetical protein